jgi:predicted ATP-dependent endonuclease of OLD family
VRIVRIHIENFRGISLADIHLNGTSVFLGDNNTGKSTVFEAIELAIGPDRLSRTQAIDEHDFHGGHYLAEGDQPRKIVIERYRGARRTALHKFSQQSGVLARSRSGVAWRGGDRPR